MDAKGKAVFKYLFYQFQKGGLMHLQVIFIYCLCDEVLKEMNVKDDDQCKMSSAEIMTFVVISAIYYQCDYKKTRLVTLSLNYFNKILSHSQLVRRVHKIPEENWILAFHICKEMLGVECSKELIVDSFPVPCCQNNKIFRCRLFQGKGYHGYTASKKSYFFGLKVHMIVDLNGVPIEFIFTPGGEADVKAFRNFEFDFLPGTKVFADKAYTDYLQEDLLKEASEITLVPRRKKRSKRTNGSYDEFCLSLYRNKIETTFSSITGLMPRCIRATTPKGFCLKLFFFIFGYLIKRMLPQD